jgi:L-ascorbate metabolism protein UlaG (beta-lactamase superfamily)
VVLVLTVKVMLAEQELIRLVLMAAVVEAVQEQLDQTEQVLLVEMGAVVLLLLFREQLLPMLEAVVLAHTHLEHWGLAVLVAVVMPQGAVHQVVELLIRAAVAAVMVVQERQRLAAMAVAVLSSFVIQAQLSSSLVVH